MTIDTAASARTLQGAGFDDKTIAAWLAAAPREAVDFVHDRSRHVQFWKQCEELVSRLPRRPQRSPAEA